MEPTLTDTLHFGFAAATVLISSLAVGIGVRTAVPALSIATLAVPVAFGAPTGKNAPLRRTCPLEVDQERERRQVQGSPYGTHNLCPTASSQVPIYT